MKDLSIHISELLRKHGCAIVPGFGGFVSNDMPARILNEGRFIAKPGSIIGFNENLTLNDGLLIQSYMQKEDLSYAAAERKVKSIVKEMKEMLSAEGELIIPNVGCIQSNMNGRMSFTAYKETFVESKYFGLFDLDLQLVADLKKKPETVFVKTDNVPRQKLNIWGYIQYAAACIVVLIMYFSSSVSIDNGSLHRYDNQASLIPTTSLFVSSDVADVMIIEDTSEKQDAAVLTREKVDDESFEKEGNIEIEAPKEEKSTVTANVDNVVQVKRYHIVVASLNVSDDTTKILESLKKDGYSDASVVESKNRIRVILNSYPTLEDATFALEQIRKNTSFKDAWVLNQKL